MGRRQKGRGPFKGRTRQTGRSQRGGIYKKTRSRRRNHMLIPRRQEDIIYYR